MIITISGTPGSGKSSIARMLAEKLNWPHYYMGGIRRAKAKELSMSLEDYNKLGETDPGTDKDIDEYISVLGKTKDNIIVESRTAWHFIPNSLKIFIEIDEKKAAFYIHRDLNNGAGARRNESDKIASEEDALDSIIKRQKSDNLRYKKYYNIDILDRNNYDFVLDTTNLTINQAFDKVYGYIKEKLAKEAMAL